MNKIMNYKVGGALAVSAVLLSPMIAAAATSTSTVQATVATVVSVTSSATVPITVTPTSSGATASASDNVTVNSNDSLGYNLTLNDSDATLTMGGSNGGTLAAASGTFSVPAALGVNSWGYRLGSFAAGTYAGISATAQNLSSPTAVSASSGDIVPVTYGVNVSTAVPAGIYTDGVTYTVTGK